MSVTSGEMSASITEAYSIDSILLSRLSPQNRAATGSTSMTVFGGYYPGTYNYTNAGRTAFTGSEGT